MFEVKYDLTRDDLFHFQDRASSSSPAARSMLRKIRATYVVAILLVAVVVQPWRSWVALSGFAIFCAVFVGGWLVWYRYVSRRLIAEYVDNNQPDKGTLGSHTIEVDDMGLTERTSVGESRVTWKGIHKVERDAAAIYIYTGPGQAHMIPLRAFTSADDAQQFFAFIATAIE